MFSAPPLQGDVGCGKTVVALLALLAAAGSGYQGALMVGVLHSGRHGATAQLALSRTRQQAPMCLGAHAPAHFACLVSPGPSLISCAQAPTEILAEQHFRSLQRLVQDMTREAGRRGETGFRQPRITLVGAGGHDKGGEQGLHSGWLAAGGRLLYTWLDVPPHGPQVSRCLL